MNNIWYKSSLRVDRSNILKENIFHDKIFIMRCMKIVKLSCKIQIVRKKFTSNSRMVMQLLFSALESFYMRFQPCEHKCVRF